MQVDKTPFPVHTLELNNPKVLLRPEQAEEAQEKNVVIGDPRPMNANGKILAREVIAEKTPDGKPTLRIFVNAPKPGGQTSSSSQPAVQVQPVRPVASTGQTGQTRYNDRSDRPREQPRTFNPKRPEEGTWKTNVPKLQGRRTNQGPTFGQLLNKYTKAVQRDRPLKKRPHSPPRRGNASPPRREFIMRKSDYPQFPPQKVYATMPWSPPASNAVNPVREHEGIWLQCFPMPYPPPYQRGGKDQGRQYTTDWEHTNLVQLSRSHRSDLSPMTGQTGLSRDRHDLFIHRLNTV